MPQFQQHDLEALARRIVRMTDRQVVTALALPDDEIDAVRVRTPQYAPVRGPTPVILWNHVDGGWPAPDRSTSAHALSHALLSRTGGWPDPGKRCSSALKGQRRLRPRARPMPLIRHEVRLS